MTIFGWSCRELWSTAHLGGIALENGTFPNCSMLASMRALAVDLLFQVLSPHPLKSIERLPLTLERWEEGNMHCERGGRGCTGMSMTCDKAEVTTAEGMGFIPSERCLHLGVCPEAGCLCWSLWPDLQQLFHGSLSTQLTSGSCMLICLNPDILGGNITFLLSSPYCALFASSSRRSCNL